MILGLFNRRILVSAVNSRHLIPYRAFSITTALLNAAPQGPKTPSSEEISTKTSKLLDDIEKTKSELDKHKNGGNGNVIKQYVNTIIESENFQNLKAELIKFNNNRSKIANEYSKSFSEKLSHQVDELRKSIAIAARVVNDVTGYTRINQLKEVITDHEQSLRDLRKKIAESKFRYSQAVQERVNSQKEINELLEKKHNWGVTELEKFTQLYKNDHELEKTVQEKSKEVEIMEEQEEETHNQLIQSIMNRYHEEQVWSDKIRQFSTWGTLLIMCVNLLLVLMVQLVFEPWKRSRLVSSFEMKVKDLFPENYTSQEEVQKLRESVTHLEALLQAQSDVTTSNEEPIAVLLPSSGYTMESIKRWFSFLKDLLNPLPLLSHTMPRNVVVSTSQSDFALFFYLFSTIFLSLGLLLGRLI